MTRARPVEFLTALKDMGLDLVNAGNDVNLAERPQLLMRRLQKAGFAVEKSTPAPSDLVALGFKPKTVFDIGVDAGTPLIYDAYPDAHFVLVDPVSESEQRVEPWRSKIDFEFHNYAVGAKASTVEINIPTTAKRHRISRASMKEYTESYSQKFVDIEKREVPVITLDKLSKSQEAPFGIKIDTEGAEMDVIKGAKQTLKKTEFVIAEVSVRERFLGGYRFSDFIGAMGKNGFEPLVFLTNIGPKATDCDVVFARYDGPHFT